MQFILKLPIHNFLKFNVNVNGWPAKQDFWNGPTHLTHLKMVVYPVG